MEDHSSSSARSDSAAKSQLLPSEVLSRAADLIEPEGKWCQGAPHGPGGSRCLVVAIALLIVPDVPWAALAEPLAIATGAGDIVQWNDAPGRTQAEVVAALRKAADLARSEGQ